MEYEKLTLKKKLLDRLRPLPKELVQNLEEWFRVELTYTSNALEGNTLTRQETAIVIEKGLTVGGKTLKEHLEATNHAHALDYVHVLIKKTPLQVTVHDILMIHSIILKGIDDDNAGHYRNVPVRISGSTVILPNARKVPELMDSFHAWLIKPHDLHPMALAIEAHYRLVSIHPFVDGNGRTARLLMNALVMMYGYPPLIIRKKDRLAYIDVLEKAQLGGSKDNYENFMIKSAERSLDLYIRAAQGKSAIHDMGGDSLLKIGGLAKEVNETVSTLRYWTKEGLIEVAEVTKSNYHLYSLDMVKRCQEIKKLKSQRLTLEEIKEQLKSLN